MFNNLTNRQRWAIGVGVYGLIVGARTIVDVYRTKREEERDQQLVILNTALRRLRNDVNGALTPDERRILDNIDYPALKKALDENDEIFGPI